MTLAEYLLSVEHIKQNQTLKMRSSEIKIPYYLHCLIKKEFIPKKKLVSAWGIACFLLEMHNKKGRALSSRAMEIALLSQDLSTPIRGTRIQPDDLLMDEFESRHTLRTLKLSRMWVKSIEKKLNIKRKTKKNKEALQRFFSQIDDGVKNDADIKGVTLDGKQHIEAFRKRVVLFLIDEKHHEIELDEA